MSYRLSLHDYQEIATKRKHNLISVSNPKTISKGTITLYCNCCNIQFTVKARSYKNSKNGCPCCKKKAISSFWSGKTREQKNKNTGIFDLLIPFLEKKNSYTEFILKRIDRSSSLTGVRTHKHHIIPKHMGAPDESWNIIVLSIEEHAEAHKLLYENYKSPFDLSSSLLLNGQTTEGFQQLRKAIRQKMKENQKSFWKPGMQSELAKRPKNRKPYSRNLYVKTALKKGILLEWIKTKEIVKIGPNECSSLVAVINKLMSYSQMVDKRIAWENCLKKEKYYGLTALTRILTGYIDKKTGKKLYTFMGWRVLGIFL